VLEPTDRRLLLDALRPPAGYTLEAAIGTTFSLDLLALLTVPLAFALFDWEDEQGRPMADPLALLEAVRRHADRMAIFCQAGKTYIPRHDQRLYAYLEPSVVDVKAPRANRAFHPKLWALSFHAPDAPTLVRVLCASRNITFDRSWDTLLVLEGEVQPRQHAFERILPLTTFLSALPDLAVQPAGDQIRVLVNQMQAEVGRTEFAPPPPFNDLRFIPLGLQQSGDEWPFVPRPQRLLVVSPFVGPGCLMRLVNRIGMLPVTVGDLRKNRINFVSLTPGTSFNLRSNLGTQHERAVVVQPAARSVCVQRHRRTVRCSEGRCPINRRIPQAGARVPSQG
jgi:hypothetical protein